MTASRFRIPHIPGLAFLRNLVRGSIAFGQGAWYPIALTFSRLKEWSRERKAGGPLAVRPTHPSGVRVARRALLHKSPRNTTEQQVDEPADTMV
jgi:hypothetical protein